jgi:hypothetical protein
MMLGLSVLEVAMLVAACGAGTHPQSSGARRHPSSAAARVGVPGEHSAAVITPTPTASVLRQAQRLGFVPTTGQLRRFCDYVALRTSRPVLCPSIIPRGPLYALNGGPYMTQRLDSAVFGMPALSSARAKYFRPGWMVNFLSNSVKAGPHTLGHWTIAEGSAGALGLLIHPYASPPPVSRSITLDGRPAKLYILPTTPQGFHSMYAGHTMVQWNVGHEIVEVSFHGHTDKQRERALIFAAALGG